MKNNSIRLVAAITSVIGIALLAFAGERVISKPSSGAERQKSAAELSPHFDGATAWLNSKPLTAASLRGKVVLVNFWTYSCINSLRQLPYIRAWAEKYRDKGLVVIGVHAPEFAFERDIDNVRRAIADLGIDYPIAVDDDHAIWRAFGNQYWPALYFIDAQGRVRYRKFGEGDYPKLETGIQQLLTEAGTHGVDGLVSVDARGAEADADWSDLRSPETYVGYARSERLRSPGGVEHDQRHDYVFPHALQLNEWALSGSWTMGKQAAVLHMAGGRMAYRFHARDLHLVMGPSARGAKVRFRVRIDGQPPGDAHGVDVDSQGNGVVTEPRMYQLIRQTPPIADHQFEIEFLDAGVQTFAFTFG